VTACLLVAGGLALAGCRGAARPVAALRIEPAELTLPYPGFVNVHLTFVPKVERRALGEQPIVFVHLLDEPGSVVRTFDHPLPSDWQEGRELAYDVRLYQSALAEPLSARTYMLSIGLLGAKGARCALDTSGKEVDRGEYAVAQVAVPTPGAGLPRFRFSDAWLPAEAGGNRQILARRWLSAAAGTLVAGDLAGPGTLWLELLVPGDGPRGRLELDAGASEPAVRLTSTCAPENSLLTGSGTHRVELEVGKRGPAECEVRFGTNFRLVSESSPLRPTVALENLAWSAHD
jgi:hypothetical protein